jgi:thiol:disulfide interchange protein
MTFGRTKKILVTFFSLSTLGVLILAVLWLTSPSQLGRAAFAATGLPERTLAEAQELARQQNKPLLLDFSAYWCGVCRKLDRMVMIDERVKARIEEKYVFVRLDSEHPDTRPLMKTYGIYGFPTLLVAQADGSPIRFIPLAFEPEKFLLSL